MTVDSGTDSDPDADTDDGPEYDTDFREHPEEYEIGRGEQDVFKVEPYKSELLPLWSIKTLAEAETAAEAIHDAFREYRDRDEFVGMDMARKYLRMGWTRAMRYAKYPGGRKYDDGEERDPQEWYDEEKREIALVYRERLDAVREDETYRRRRAEWTD
ncbi:MAG: DUF4385 family protein [Haloplanus sp.]